MADTYVNYTGDGATDTFSVPFSYISKDYVKVYLDDVLYSSVNVTWLTASSIQLASAPGVGVVVTVKRETPRASLITTIPSSGTLRGKDINSQSTQVLNVVAEAFDALINNISYDLVNDVYDADSKRIVNVADPVDAQDAATKAWSEASGTSFVGAAAASATAAASSASAAASSASSASSSQSAAATSASNASTSASGAATSASNASTSETNAAASAAAAAASAIAAAASETAADASAVAAGASEGAAAASASAAATSASNASTSATNAAASETAAAASAASIDSDTLSRVTVPGGRLTLTSGDPWITSDQNNLGTIYYTPATSNRVQLYSTAGTKWIERTFSELSLALSGLTASRPHDLYLNWNGSTVVLSAVAWTNTTTRAKTPVLVNGRWVHPDDSEYLWIGTVYVGAANTTYDSVLYRYVFNAYNARRKDVRWADSTSHTYTTAAWRDWRAVTAASVVNGSIKTEHIAASLIAQGYNSTSNIWYAGINNATMIQHVLTGSTRVGGTYNLSLAPGFNSIVPTQYGHANSTFESATMVVPWSC